MRKLVILAALLVVAPHQAASAAKVDNQYAKWKLFQPYGYRDLKLSPGRWKVRSLSYHAGMDFTVMMALHRVAVHAKANGFENLVTVSMKVTCSNLFGAAPSGCKGTSLDEEVDVIAVGFNQGDPVPACEEDGLWAENCRQYGADDLLLSLREPLKLTVGAVEQEIAAARSKAKS